MTRDELSDEIRAVMFLVSSEASMDGYDERMLRDAHTGLMAMIDRYLEGQASTPINGRFTRSRRRPF
jgi:hypothetical protein